MASLNLGLGPVGLTKVAHLAKMTGSEGQTVTIGFKKKKGYSQLAVTSEKMVPKAGLEPARALPTTPSRWRVCHVPPLRRFFKLTVRPRRRSFLVRKAV